MHRDAFAPIIATVFSQISSLVPNGYQNIRYRDEVYGLYGKSYNLRNADASEEFLRLHREREDLLKEEQDSQMFFRVYFNMCKSSDDCHAMVDVFEGDDMNQIQLKAMNREMFELYASSIQMDRLKDLQFLNQLDK
jgi:hypothetical protein